MRGWGGLPKDKGTWLIECKNLLGSWGSNHRDPGVKVRRRRGLFLLGLLTGDLLEALSLLGPDVSLRHVTGVSRACDGHVMGM